MSLLAPPRWVVTALIEASVATRARPPGHDDAARGGGKGVDADGHRLGREAGDAVAAQHRRLRQRQVFLGHIGVGAGAQTRDHRFARRSHQRAAEHRLEMLVGIGRLDHQVIQVRQHVLERRLLPAPPGGHRGQDQRLRPAGAPRRPGGSPATRPTPARRCPGRWPAPRVPARTAPSSPGTPRAESLRSSSGSQKSSSSRRRIACTRFSPASVFR